MAQAEPPGIRLRPAVASDAQAIGAVFDAAGRGVGRMLLTAADSALRAAGCREAFLYTHEQNERALHVYASAGYRPDGSIRETDFRGTRMRELRLVKRL